MKLENLARLWRQTDAGCGVGDVVELLRLLKAVAVELATACPDHPTAQAVLSAAGKQAAQRRLF
ncbi:hypothetical protein EDD75_0300 [Thermodesulfitimonas autotrophica]|uniref:Uncharacterized protein n=1 Tax=Thermodesulfitimonas autotrophica TaxID=1894989 RepID=A0A3N5AWX3_9THEO|nr:hypothetical protein [Thermodesulfitimonas autotrophica]RPF49484.1 hypothetical protein EDD75_0300 [Thermodesulfitimonas autotrophica]